MSAIVIVKESTRARSIIACCKCRAQKIKCSRELPQCLICQTQKQQCSYPPRAQKPSPKVGSSQNTRRRRRQDHEQRQASGTTLQDNFESENEDRRTRLSHETSPSEQSSTSHTSYLKYSQHIQSLSYTIHPNHESCALEDGQDITPAVNPTYSKEAFLTSTCYLLGIGPDLMKHLCVHHVLGPIGWLAVQLLHIGVYTDGVQSQRLLHDIHIFPAF
jgi:hypothetical protein